MNTNFTLSPSHSFHTSSYHKSCLLSLPIFRGHSTREPASSRVTYFIQRAYTVTGVSHSEHRKKNRESSLVKSPVKPVLSMTVGGCQDSKFLLARNRRRFSIEFSNEPSVTDSDCHLSKPHCTMVSFKTQDTSLSQPHTKNPPQTTGFLVKFVLFLSAECALIRCRACSHHDWCKPLIAEFYLCLL